MSLLAFLLNLRISKEDLSWNLLGDMHCLLIHSALLLCFSAWSAMELGGFMLSELTIESKGLSTLSLAEKLGRLAFPSAA